MQAPLIQSFFRISYCFDYANEAGIMNFVFRISEYKPPKQYVQLQFHVKHTLRTKRIKWQPNKETSSLPLRFKIRTYSKSYYNS